MQEKESTICCAVTTKPYKRTALAQSVEKKPSGGNHVLLCINFHPESVLLRRAKNLNTEG